MTTADIGLPPTIRLMIDADSGVLGRQVELICGGGRHRLLLFAAR
ncbi:hypothetical protein [Nocardia sp. NPDC057440]